MTWKFPSLRKPALCAAAIVKIEVQNLLTEDGARISFTATLTVSSEHRTPDMVVAPGAVALAYLPEVAERLVRRTNFTAISEETETFAGTLLAEFNQLAEKIGGVVGAALFISRVHNNEEEDMLWDLVPHWREESRATTPVWPCGSRPLSRRPTFRAPGEYFDGGPRQHTANEREGRAGELEVPDEAIPVADGGPEVLNAVISPAAGEPEGPTETIPAASEGHRANEPETPAAEAVSPAAERHPDEEPGGPAEAVSPAQEEPSLETGTLIPVTPVRPA